MEARQLIREVSTRGPGFKFHCKRTDLDPSAMTAYSGKYTGYPVVSVQKPLTVTGTELLVAVPLPSWP